MTAAVVQPVTDDLSQGSHSRCIRITWATYAHTWNFRIRGSGWMCVPKLAGDSL